MATVIDFSAGPPSAASIKRAGHTGVVRYLSDGREDWMTGKRPTREQLDAYDREGLKFAFVWQYGAGNPIDSDVMRGREGGLADAREAKRRLEELGCAGHPVIFAVDFEAKLTQWNSTIVHYFRAACEVLGRQRVGIYGHSRAIAWAMEDGVVATTGPGRVLGWQTKSWSKGVEATSYASLYQHTHGDVFVDGVEIDINDVWHEEWGWRAIPEVTSLVPAGAPVIIDRTQDYDFGGWRSIDDIQAIFVHTTENALGTPAENIVDWQTVNPQGRGSGSYHTLVDTEKLIECNTAGWIAWGTGNKGNQVGLHISFVWRAAATRAEWLAQQAFLLRGAWKVAQWVKEHNLPIIFVGGADLRAGVEGISTHNESRIAWGVTTHTDPGEGFPMDVFIDMVADFVDGNLGTEEGAFLMALTHEEQYEALGILRQLKTHYLDPKETLVEGSKFKVPVHEYIQLTDRKVEELHVEYHGRPSAAQTYCDDREAENAAAIGDHDQEVSDAN